MVVETKNTIPMWLAVAITVCVSLPFGLWFKEWNVPLWASFIVWAEYFVLGGKPEGLKIMVPSYILGVIGAVLVLIVMVVFQKAIPDVKLVSATDVAIVIAFFLAFCALIYAMKFMPVTGGAGTLPFFNGISMGLGTYFCLAYFTYGGLNFGSDYLVPIVTGIPAILAGLLGAFLGWFNVTILFPRAVTKTSQQAAHA
jgi:Protein of unknown function (DUF1097)